jgi:uncharacterized protein YkwD
MIFILTTFIEPQISNMTIQKYSSLLVLIAVFLVVPSSAQKKLNSEELQFVSLVNLARTNPQGFIKQNKDVLTISSASKFMKALGSSKPLNPIKVSDELCLYASQSASGNLNPAFPSAFCGSSSGTGSGSTSAMNLVIDYANNILSPDYTHVGVSISGGANDKKYAICWSRECSYSPPRFSFSFTGTIDSSKIDSKKINTAVGITWMSSQEISMLKEINFARCYPQVYADIVEQSLTDEARSWGGVSYDDYSAGKELLEELRSAQPLNPLLPSECIYLVAKAHGQEEVKRGFTGHQGTNGSWPWDRILGKCKDMAEGNENLVGGGRGTPRSSVIQLLVDGGISSRGHRYNTLDPKWTHASCYYAGKVGNMPDCWVQNYGVKK